MNKVCLLWILQSEHDHDDGEYTSSVYNTSVVESNWMEVSDEDLKKLESWVRKADGVPAKGAPGYYFPELIIHGDLPTTLSKILEEEKRQEVIRDAKQKKAIVAAKARTKLRAEKKKNREMKEFERLRKKFDGKS